MTSRTPWALASLLLVLAAAGPPALAAQPTALVGGTLHTVSGPTLREATLVMREGRIVAMGSDVAVPAEARVVDVRGQHVYPALFAADTVLGLAEISSVRGTIDTTEVGDINPHVRAEVALNPDSELLPVTRSNGILLALTAPRGGLISGTSAVIRLDGWTWEDMTVKAPAALHVAWPRMSVDRSPRAEKKPEEQRKAIRERLQQLDEAFDAARAYLKARRAEAQPGVPLHDADPRWEAMRPALEGEIPVVVHASGLTEMRAAVAWAGRHRVKLVIAGATDAWRMTDELKQNDVAVIVNPVLGLPRRDDDPYDSVYSLPGRLHQAGVEFAIATGSSSFGAANTRVLPYHAAMAWAFDLPHDAALRAITLNPARILGLDDSLGSLEVGKEATLFVADGDPLDLRSRVLRAYIAGREIDLDDRQKRLYRKYRDRPRRTQAAD